MKQSISFIGAGKVATALGMHLKDYGFEIVGYLSKNELSAKKAASITKSESYTNLEELINNSEIVWITTPDDQIEAVAKQIATLNISNIGKKLFVHASGVHTTDVLRPLSDAGLNVAAAHPLLAFGEALAAAQALTKVSFAVEEYELKISTLLNACGNSSFEIEKDKKAMYHAAACVMSNYVVTLADVALRMFAKAGLPNEHVQRATMPLMESVIENLRERLPMEALTGPIKRGDADTVRMHIETISQLMPEALDLYMSLGRETMAMIDDYKLKDILE